MSKKVQAVLMSLFYIIAGINHFINPLFYIEVVPDFISEKALAVAVSGLFEIVLAFFLIFKDTRRIAAKCIILMLFLFLLLVHFPMIFDYYKSNNSLLWFAIIRVPIQFFLIFWAYKISKVKVESQFY